MIETEQEEKSGGVLTPRHYQLIAALLTEPTQTAAAEKAGVSLPTVTRWMHDPQFKTELRAAEAGVLEMVSRRAASMAIRALELLEEVIGDTTLGPGIRVRASLGLLDQVVKLRQHADIEDRLVALEEAAARMEAQDE